MIDYEKLVKGIVAGLKEALNEDSNKVDEEASIADTVNNLFKDKEYINEFIENTVKDAQELAKESEENGSTFVTGKQNKEEHKSLEQAVASFFSLIKSTENAKDFSIGLQDAMALSSFGRFGLGTETGLSYGKYNLTGATLTLSSGSVTVYHTLSEEDVTNDKLFNKLFFQSDEDTHDMCGCGDECCDGYECDEDCEEEYDAEEHLYSIRDDIEEAESDFFDKVGAIMSSIPKHYRQNPPSVENVTQDDEDVMIFYLTHKSSFYAPAILQAMSRYDLVTEFIQKAELNK